MTGDNAPTHAMSLRTLGFIGIIAGVLGVAWNLLSIAGVSAAYYEFRERAQDRAAVAEADRAEAARRATRAPAGAKTAPVTVIMVTAPPVPWAVTAGVGLSVAIFILNTALAFVLLGASGILPRRPERAGPLLRLYPSVKPPAAVLAGVAWWWLLRLAFDRTSGVHVVGALLVVALGCAYPALLAAVTRRTSLLSSVAPRGS